MNNKLILFKETNKLMNLIYRIQIKITLILIFLKFTNLKIMILLNYKIIKIIS